jgi:hypothetical protein
MEIQNVTLEIPADLVTGELRKYVKKSYEDTLKYHTIEDLSCPGCGGQTLEADNIGGFYLRCRTQSCAWRGNLLASRSNGLIVDEEKKST